MTVATSSEAPHTQTVRRALQSARDSTEAADLLFLEAWEMHSRFDVAATLRASQIRRANPALAAQLRAELQGGG